MLPMLWAKFETHEPILVWQASRTDFYITEQRILYMTEGMRRDRWCVWLEHASPFAIIGCNDPSKKKETRGRPSTKKEHEPITETESIESGPATELPGVEDALPDSITPEV